jgi:hypothetical protein
VDVEKAFHILPLYSDIYQSTPSALLSYQDKLRSSPVVPISNQICHLVLHMVTKDYRLVWLQHTGVSEVSYLHELAYVYDPMQVFMMPRRCLNIFMLTFYVFLSISEFPMSHLRYNDHRSIMFHDVRFYSEGSATTLLNHHVQLCTFSNSHLRNYVQCMPRSIIDSSIKFSKFWKSSRFFMLSNIPVSNWFCLCWIPLG